MNCFSQKTACSLRNFGSNEVPRYTILARPNSQAIQTQSIQLSNPRMRHEPSCIAPTKEVVSSSTFGNACDSPEAQVLKRTSTEIHTSWSSNSPSDQNLVPSASAIDELSAGSVGEPALSANASSAYSACALSGDTSWQFKCLPEKTPISRVNELSRFNKIASQFALVAEEGPPHQKTFYVQLILGEEVYHGEASSMKKAQHNVAKMALERTKYSHPPFKCVRSSRQVPTAVISKSNTMNCSVGVEQQNVSVEVSDPTNCAGPASSQTIHNIPEKAAIVQALDKTELSAKSVINEVQELAVKLGLLAVYNTDEESHATNTSYLISCTCGSLVTLGSGATKKAAKKVAAANMLEALKTAIQCQVPELEYTRPVKKPHSKKKKSKGIVKLSTDIEKTVDGSQLSFAVRLFQVQQAKRASLPEYKDKGIQAGEFYTEVTIDGVTCSGVGKTKKQAKQDAASKMLEVLGFHACGIQEACGDIASTPMPAKSALKKSGTSPGFSSDKKVTFIDPERGREFDQHTSDFPSEVTERVSPFPSTCPNGQPRKVQILKRPMKNDGGKSTLSSVETSSKESAALSSDQLVQIIDAQDQPANLRLHRLAALLCLTVQFVDLPQSTNVDEHVSMVTLSTDPPLINHGAGSTLESARIAASQELLAMLKEFDVLQTLINGKCERGAPTES